MPDTLNSYSDSPLAPSRSMFTVSPHDTDPLPYLPKALYVGTGGSITLRCIDDTTDVVFRNLPAGAIVRARARFVRATGTTAADILAHC